MKLDALRKWLVPLFWAAACFALVMALLPRPPQLPGAPSDKTQHILAFCVLTALAVGAYPKARLPVLCAALSTFGALIELLQAIPQLHRDASVADWAADTLAVLFVAGLIALLRTSSVEPSRRR